MKRTDNYRVVGGEWLQKWLLNNPEANIKGYLGSNNQYLFENGQCICLDYGKEIPLITKEMFLEMWEEEAQEEKRYTETDIYYAYSQGTNPKGKTLEEVMKRLNKIK